MEELVEDDQQHLKRNLTENSNTAMEVNTTRNGRRMRRHPEAKDKIMAFIIEKCCKVGCAYPKDFNQFMIYC